MKKNNFDSEKIFSLINPPKEEIKEMNSTLDNFLVRIEKRIKEKKREVNVFVGGSFSKGTVTKKEIYDADVFFRYEKKIPEKSFFELTKKILSKEKNVEIIHGSRDYFRIKFNDKFFIEIIPVRKISNPEKAENITDLSYLHVKYLNKKIKDKKLLEEIKIAKAFCIANNFYGAESYIQGFSGYSLELLILYYGNFTKMLKGLIKVKEDKLIIDIEKFYKKKNEIFLEINESKLVSPIILIDPTYKTRNALAALSEQTFRDFQKVAENFLKNPSEKYFEKKKVDLELIKKKALKSKKEFELFEIKTFKQEGDIAGTKLLKFYKHFLKEVSKYFNVSKKGFNYNLKKSARFFIVASRKKELIISGPFISDKESCVRFCKEHSNVFEKKGKTFARELENFSLKEFFEKWKKKNSQKIKEMYVEEFYVA